MPVAPPGRPVRSEFELAGPVGVVGTGLIGASLGLALRAAGVDVLLADLDPHQLDLAVAMGAGRPWDSGRVAHAVLAVPPQAVAPELLALQRGGLAASASDVASVKAAPVEQAVALGCDLATFCGGHPIAGRERGGAVSARAELFRDRTWVVTPTEATRPDVVRTVSALARTCGARPVVTSPARHDVAMAALSHLPQVVASLLATEVEALPPEELQLAGQGFRDVTRLADSDPELWSQIVSGNRAAVAAGARRLGGALLELAGTLAADPDPAEAVAGVVARGNAARTRLPEKADGVVHHWAWVGAVVDDREGQLAALLSAVSGWAVNVEDISVEHSRDAPAGIVELAVEPALADGLQERLRRAGWTAYRRA